MRTPRKTVTALVVSIVLVIGTGIVAATAILDLRVPGFTAQNADRAAAAPTATSAPTPPTEPASTSAPGPAPVTRHAADAASTRTAAGPLIVTTAGGSGAAAPVFVPSSVPSSAPSSSPPPATSASPAPPAPTSPAPPAPTSPPSPSPSPSPSKEDPQVAPPSGDAIPPAPAGCSEAEWDSEHRYWKCHVDEPGDD